MESHHDGDIQSDQEGREPSARGSAPVDGDPILEPVPGHHGTEIIELDTSADFSALINRNEYHELMRAALAQAELEGFGEERGQGGSEAAAGGAAVEPVGRPYVRLSSLCALAVVFFVVRIASGSFVDKGLSQMAARQQIQSLFGSDAGLIRVTDAFFTGTPLSSRTAGLTTSVEDLNQVFDYIAQSSDKKAHLDPRGFILIDGVTTYQSM